MLCLTSSFPRWPGDHEGNFVFQLARGLIKHEWETHVLAPHVPESHTREELDGVLVRRFRYVIPEGLETVCGGGSAMVTLRKQPIELLKLPPLLTSQFLHTVYLLSRNRYSLIHAHWLIPQGFMAVLAARLLKIPTVITVHGGDVFRLRSPFFNAIKRFTLSRADCITVNSPATREAVLALKPDIKNLHEIPMGIPESIAAEKREKTWGKDTQQQGEPLTIIFVGRLAAEKGVEDLLNAGRILIQKGINIRLILVGDGQERQDFESISRTLGIEAHTDFIGALPHNQVLALLQKADVFVAPSRITKDGWQEAQGLSIAEAMAVGIPVVATRVGGIPSMVQHRETGLLVSPQAPLELAQAMEFLLSNRGIASEMARRARTFILDYCGQSRVTATFADLFDKIAAQRT